jgi:chromosome segregation ATPase
VITDQGMDKISNIPQTPNDRVESMRNEFATARARLLEERKEKNDNWNKMAQEFQAELDSLNDRIAMLNRALDDYPEEQKTMNAPSNYDRH